MDDMEKGRVTYVANMEQQLQHMKSEHDKYKAIARKWEPIVTTEIDAGSGRTKFGLQFGGKNVQAEVSSQFLVEMDTVGATTQIVDVLIESLVKDQLSKVLAPIVERAQNGARAVSGAGKW